MGGPEPPALENCPDCGCGGAPAGVGFWRFAWPVLHRDQPQGQAVELPYRIEQDGYIYEIDGEASVRVSADGALSLPLGTYTVREVGIGEGAE